MNSENRDDGAAAEQSRSVGRIALGFIALSLIYIAISFWLGSLT